MPIGAGSYRYCVSMEETGPVTELDRYLPRPIRTYLEERFWRPIEAQATLEVLRDDPRFLADPGTHPAIFADHGIVHVRDVAIGPPAIVGHDRRRPPARSSATTDSSSCRASASRWRTCTTSGWSTCPSLAGGCTRCSRRMPRSVRMSTPLVDHLLATGPVGTRLAEIADRAPFATPLETVIREMLSTTVAHSKSAVPADVLDDRVAFRRVLQRVVFTRLDDLRAATQLAAGVGHVADAGGCQHRRL